MGAHLYPQDLTHCSDLAGQFQDEICFITIICRATAVAIRNGVKKSSVSKVLKTKSTAVIVVVTHTHCLFLQICLALLCNMCITKML